MANEITTSGSMTVANGTAPQTLAESFDSGALQVDQTNARSIKNSQDIGTTAENIETGDLTSPGYCIAKNLDSSNYVEIGVDSSGFVAVIKVQPGKTAGPFEFADSLTPQAKANSGACRVQFTIFDK